MNIDTGKITRITHAPGQDVLPVFSATATKVLGHRRAMAGNRRSLWMRISGASG